MIIRTTYLNRMRTGEVQTFGSRILKCIETFDLTGLMLLVMFNKLNDSVELLKQVLVKYHQTDITKALKESDRIRDDIFLSFRKSLASIALRRNPERAAMANRLLDVIRQHGWEIHNMNYADETSHLTDLIRNLKGSNELLSVVNTLGLDDNLEELRMAQEEFENIFYNRAQASATLMDLNGSDASKVVLADCMKLFQAIDSLYSITQKAEYMQMALLINEVVDSQAQIIRARITRGKDEGETNNNKTK